jgi:hypothetical protein
MSAEATKDKAEVALMKYILTLMRLEIVMSFTNGQKNNQNGYKMRYTRMTMMHDQQQEPLIFINQTKVLVRKLRQRMIRVLLWKLAQKIHVLKWMLQNQVKRYVSLLYKRCRLNNMRNKLTQ